MIRLFVAVNIPNNIKRLIAGLGGSIPRAQPVPEEQLHLTLKFIGEVENSRLIDIREGLNDISFYPFKLNLKGVGTFPPRGSPRVLWVGIEPQDNLQLLRNKIEKALAYREIPREKRKFAPHLTIARLKSSPIKRLHQFLAGNSFLQSPDFSVSSFSLYSSQITPKGAIHSNLQTCYAIRDNT